MQDESVILFTKERFPTLAGGDFRVAPLEKGGSGRKFYRISGADAASMIVVKYTPQRPENLRYVDIAQFLDGSSVRVPRIFFHDPTEGLIWMQDLGEDDLWTHRDADWDVRRPLYQSALESAARLHIDATARAAAHPVDLELEFDEPLYLWEQNYFVENCLVGVFGMAPDRAAQIASLPELTGIAKALSQEPRVLVHRDLQSQNVLIHEDRAWLIDFQGMRPGLAQYDLASLLCDPYVSFTNPERQQLLAFYKGILESRSIRVSENFDTLYLMCAAQRLMQALGAYGFLGLQAGRPDFLNHIPTARTTLREVASQIDGLDQFVRVLEDLEP